MACKVLFLLAASAAALTAPPRGVAVAPMRSSALRAAGGAAEPRAGPAGLFDKAIVLGAKKTELSIQQMVALGIVSGAHIAFGAFLLTSVGGCCPGLKATNPGLQKIILGLFGIPMGLLMTVSAGGELATGNFALCTAALLEDLTTLQKCLRNWAVVLTANFAGAVLLAALATVANTGVGPAGVAIATTKVSATWAATFAKGLLCNWLVCTAVWMSTSTPDIGAKAAAVIFPISGFVALGLEHSVANMFLIPFGMMQGASISVSDMFLKNLIPCTLGNFVGGAVFVAGFYKTAYGSK
ncbi:Formate/nitrite transporter [Pelagophyceae sp. CCMP2097]|nr:Formate/nitrite transporter [Pelagophyceae sp. CCMP2097]